MEYLDKGVKPEDIETFDKLMRDSNDFANFTGEEPNEFGDKYGVMKIIDSGNDSLPQTYHNVFVDPLRELIQTEDLEDIKKIYEKSGALDDWLLCLTQRTNSEDKDLALATDAMEEFIADIFDGNLSDTARKGATLPAQIVSPLIKWGSNSPYTWSSKMGARFGMKMPILSMPKRYSENILFWVLGGHECYHSVVDAYGTELLNELENLITDEFNRKTNSKNKESFDEGHLNDVQIWRQEIDWNNDKKKSLAEFASIYWRRIMDETVADICSLLNLGPSAGIAFAVLAITRNQNKLKPDSEIDDPHPNDLLRIHLAKEFTRSLVWLNNGVRQNYIKFFENLIGKYAPNAENFTLYTKEVDSGTKITEVQISIENMVKTIEVVVDKIAHTRLKTLGSHSLAEINTWTNTDEMIANVAAVEFFMKDKDLNFHGEYFKDKVYASHIVAGATVALTKKPEIVPITKLAIKYLKELHDENPVWRGFPVSFRSDADKAKGLFEPGN